MKTRQLIIAVTALVAGIAVIIRFGTGTWGILSGINLAVIVVIGGLVISRVLDNWKDEREGLAVKDERTILVEAKAGRAAFQVGNYIWLALLWYEFLSQNWLPTPKIGSPPVLIIGMMGQIAVYFYAMRHYWKHTQ